MYCVAEYVVLYSLCNILFHPDPLRTTQGYLALKAYRLTPAMMDFYREADFTPDAVKAAGISFAGMFEEIPVMLRNSHLVNALLCEVERPMRAAQEFNYMDLATRYGRVSGWLAGWLAGWLSVRLSVCVTWPPGLDIRLIPLSVCCYKCM
jgi:hypothetical protein